MNEIKLAGDFSNDVAREIDELRAAANAASTELRTLQDLEMGWVAGGDGQPVWP